MIKNYEKGGTQKLLYAENELEHVNCLNCSSNNGTILHREFGSIGIVKCNNCELIYTNPRPQNSENNYDGNIHNFENEFKYIYNGSLSHHRDKNYKQEIFFIKKHRQKGKLLDIGCNMGRFLHLANKKGFEGYGIEPSSSLFQLCVEKMKLNVENCMLLNTKHKDASFDIVTAIDVFEHISKPKEFLEKSNKLLKKNGILIIKIPNGNYSMLKFLLAKITKRNLSELDIFDSYEHVAHYNKKSFKKMIKKSNFVIEKIYAPLPITPPIWSKYVGQYYQYPSPWILDWKKNIFRSICHFIGKIEILLNLKTNFQPDLMFVLKKKI